MGKVIAIIPARGGSERVKNKNIRNLNGFPLIAWTIYDLKDAKLIDDIYVSTDDIKIEEIVSTYDVKIIERPKYLADSLTHIDEVIIHALDNIKEECELIGIFQCTTPFRDPKKIDEGILKMRREKADSLFFATELERFIWNRKPEPINYKLEDRPRSQDKEWEIVETGDYLVKPEIIKRYKCRLGGKIIYQLTTKLSYFDIDTEEDLKIANGIARGLGLYATN